MVASTGIIIAAIITVAISIPNIWMSTKIASVKGINAMSPIIIYFEKKINLASLYSDKEYSYYQSDSIMVKGKKVGIDDFYSNKIIEDYKSSIVKKVKFEGEAYMLGAIARMIVVGWWIPKLK